MPLLAAAGVAALALALALARTLTRPVERLNDAARRFAQGGLTEVIEVHGSDEIAGLAGAHAGSKGRPRGIRASGESLRELGGAVSETGGAAREIAAAVQQQSVGIAQIAAALRDLDGGMSETVQRLTAVQTSADELQETARMIAAIPSEFRIDHDAA